MTSTPFARRHDLDALRVIAFGTLILYHVAMFYVADWDWHVKSQYLTTALQPPMLLMNRWRMELLFLISGLALSLLRGRGTSTARLAGSRSLRLLLPLAFGMAVIIPVQPYCQMLAKHVIGPGFIDFLLRYWSGRGFPPDSYGGWEHGWTWNHLWYLAYLWCYTMLLLPLMALLESGPGRRLRGALLSLRGPALLFLPALPYVIDAWLLQSRFPETHDLFHDGFIHTVYFTIFLYGFLIGVDRGLWQELTRLRFKSLGYAAVLFGCYLLLIHITPDDLPEWQLDGIRYIRWTYMWVAICSVLGWGHHLLNRPFRWLPYASEAVFPWYVLHQSLIVPLAFWLSGWHLGPVLEPLLVLTGTLAGCALLHECLIRRSGFLRPLFGLKARAPARPGTVPAAILAG